MVFILYKSGLHYFTSHLSTWNYHNNNSEVIIIEKVFSNNHKSIIYIGGFTDVQL